MIDSQVILENNILQTGYLDNGDLLRVVKSFLQKKPAKSIFGLWLWWIGR